MARSNLTDLTTVSIHLQERGTYQPTAPPDFGTTVEETFFGSLKALVVVGKSLVIGGAAVTPWLPLLAVMGLGIWLLVKRKTPAGRVKPTEPAATTPS